MSAEKKPNFLIIVADDLGFSDCGCFGSEIRTPNIDKLAKDGIRTTGFHAAATCSPTRSMILTGTDHHIAGLGNLIEWTNFNSKTQGNAQYSTAPQRGMPGYEGYLNERVAALPEILRDNGYHTYLAGKWHLGLKPERFPYQRGFERSFALLPGCSNHFGYHPEAEAGNEIPDCIEMSVIALHAEDDHYVRELPADWYSSNGYGDKMLEYLKDWKTANDNQPFFAYYPFSAPHWPLQAPKEYLDHYKGVYDEGPEALRKKRLANLEKLGIINLGTEPHPVVLDEVAGWDELSEDKQKSSSKAMEAYAAMVEAMDHNIGRVMDYLDSIGELDNTYIMFMSDNGAEGAAYEAFPMIQGPLVEHLTKYYNNSYENIGNKDSFVWYGPHWAQAATAPSRLYKAYTTEGGVRVPCVTRFPKFTSDKAGQIFDTFTTVMDITPTILDMAGISHPAPTFRGKEVVPMRGKSMVPWLSNQTSLVHEKDFVCGWEMCGRGAIRKANWKAVFIPPPKGNGAWQLYDLSVDPGEIHDQASAQPAILAELMAHWDKYVAECGIIPLQPELGEYLVEMEEQMPENAWIEYEFWRKGALEDDKREKFYKDIPLFESRLGKGKVEA